MSFSIKTTHPYVNPSQSATNSKKNTNHFSLSSDSDKKEKRTGPSTYQVSNQPTHGTAVGLSVRQTISAMEDFL